MAEERRKRCLVLPVPHGNHQGRPIGLFYICQSFALTACGTRNVMRSAERRIRFLKGGRIKGHILLTRSISPWITMSAKKCACDPTQQAPRNANQTNTGYLDAF